MSDRDVKTVLAYLQGAQTIVALYESLGGPELHTFAFKALAEALSTPALLAAQLHLAPGHATVMLIAEPIGATVVMPLRDTDGSPQEIGERLSCHRVDQTSHDPKKN